ncbi:DUF2252 domain-containing protein [Pseudomonas sp. TE3610]
MPSPQSPGKAARKHCPRSSHRHPGDIDRDPLALIEASSKGRVKSLVALRYGRMLVSPFTFYRGSALLQAHDLAGTPDMGLNVPLCGDAHLMNFGGFATPERNLVFGLNDFDEAHPGPWEWDLKRLTASFLIAARSLRHNENVEEALCREVVNSYQATMTLCAEQGVLNTWYGRISPRELMEQPQSSHTLEYLRQTIEKAHRRTHARLLPKIVDENHHGHLTLRDDLPEIFHLHGKHSLLDHDDDWLAAHRWQPLYKALISKYRTTLQGDRRELFSRFDVHDLAFKVVGVGSVGTRCLVALLTDELRNPLFLQFKEARRSVLADYVKARSPFKHHGQRVVEGQRLMQPASDLFLGWTASPNGHHFYLRQLRDMKVSAELETFDDQTLAAYARLCGRALARAHAKASGEAATISGYIGRSQALADALFAYAQAYAAQNEKDYERFQQACRAGRLQARIEADFTADRLP